jgi:hypothetical protein
MLGEFKMSRLSWFLVCIVLGLSMLVCGLLVPAHLRAVDSSIIEKAGRNTPGVIDQALALVKNKNLGAAQLILQAAQQEQISDRQKLLVAVGTLANENPCLQTCGSPELSTLIPPLSPPTGERVRRTGEGMSQPFTEWVIRVENRQKVLEFLRASPRPELQELLRFRTVNNTVLFPPSQSSSGQALDAALSICGLLLEGGHLSTRLSGSVSALVAQANRGGNTQAFEQVLMDLLSLGRRFNWGQLTAFVSQINDPETLRLLTEPVRKANGQLPVLFAAVQLSGNPAAVSRYLMTFSQTGLKDVGSSLRFGAGGLQELLRRNQRLLDSGVHPNLAVGYCLRLPWFAVTMKWLIYLFSGFLLAAAVHSAKAPASAWERPPQVRGFHVAREILFALGFLLVVLLLSEPFLAQDSQKVEFPFRLRLPTTGSLVPAGIASVSASVMNQLSLLALLLFFVLQGLLYTASVFKLAEIGRQKVPPRMKLRLLENEDHLFDAGLYLGFVGTIISLILVSLGVIKPSLMAAYSSTSFGIIFVSIFKIFHLRPARRRLLLEAETSGSKEPLGATGPQALAVHL